MYQTSQEYKDLMKRPVRNQSFMKVQLGLINQDAQQSAELQDQEKYNGFSDIYIPCDHRTWMWDDRTCSRKRG